jgi:hypothetical protein
LPCRPIAAAIISFILECISSSAVIARVRDILGLEASTASDHNTTIPQRKAHAVVRRAEIPYGSA